MHKLPVELQRLCVGFLGDDADTLKALRKTNKQLGSLATETLFEVVVINNEEDSSKRFQALADSSFTSLVRCVIINTSDDPHHSGGGMDTADIAESFKDAIAIMHTFQKIEEVQLRFAEECAVDDDGWGKEVAETEGFRAEILELVLPAIRRIDSVKSLTLKNLQDSHDEGDFESEDFITVRQRISKLHLQIATEYVDAAPEYNIDKPALHQGFSDILPNIWLKPMSHQLTHLSLYSDCLWGVWPIVDFRCIPPFTQLRSLSLGNFMFAHDWQTNWIAAHSSTLEALFLDDCSIVTDLSMTEEQARANFPDWMLAKTEDDDDYSIYVPLRWYTIFERFSNDLSRLRHFAFGHGEWDSTEAFETRYKLSSSIHEERYYSFTHGWGPSPWSTPDFHCSGAENTLVDPEEGDEEALQSLLKVVQQRAAGKA